MPPRKQIGVPSTAPTLRQFGTDLADAVPAQAAIEEELAGEVQDAAAGQDASEERKASAVDSLDWSTLTRESQFYYGNEEENISVGTGFHLLGTNKHISSQ
ncbi:hypothetical protein QC762_0082040 [Podospora pseudocomata]|uniref:Uncharacterized protein n=1 Tax=Podospora pseudocomata TaxID=2093779 RepID=A0ABR0GC20_9PEZI|nr:hypothetical protein QC762_0082040 [Podospora pseudocomata]